MQVKPVPGDGYHRIPSTLAAR